MLKCKMNWYRIYSPSGNIIKTDFMLFHFIGSRLFVQNICVAKVKLNVKKMRKKVTLEKLMYIFLSDKELGHHILNEIGSRFQSVSLFQLKAHIIYTWADLRRFLFSYHMPLQCNN